MKTYYIVYSMNNGLSLNSSFIATDIDFDSAEGIRAFNQQLSEQLQNPCFMVSFNKVAPLPEEDQSKEPLTGKVATPSVAEPTDDNEDVIE